MKQNHNTIVKLTVTALFMAMNIALSSFGMPVPGGRLYLNDIVICLAAILMDPLQAFVVGGIGAFIGDFFSTLHRCLSPCYSWPSGCCDFIVFTQISEKQTAPCIRNRSAVGAVIMVVGYSLGRAFIYSTPEYALLKLPFQILQAVVGAVVGMLLCWKLGIHKLYTRITNSEQA